jgi:hypothetical protein
VIAEQLEHDIVTDAGVEPTARHKDLAHLQAALSLSERRA